ncbi:MAG TPA: AI-2E family transporter YdiK [Rubrivivax sp.]|nr:AI-2E family transporter YdiK [Burkholderiales bacterium]HNT37956.1 AI-2E family transporter YdiK [Rubrivivax sp.]
MIRDPTDLTRVTFAVLALTLLVGAALWVLRPFIGPAVWATMVVVATWPLMLRLQRLAGGRRWIAAGTMTLLLLLLLVVPLVLAIATLVLNADELLAWTRVAAAYRPEREAPAWLLGLPMVGAWLGRLWEQAVAAGLGTWLQRLTPYAGTAARWLLTELGGVGMLVLQFLLTVIVAGLLYGCGETAADQVRRFAQRLAGEAGVSTVALAAAAIRGVALGVGLTALLQSAFSGVALFVAGIPFAGLLTALILVLCIAQLGALPVLVPATIWLFYGDKPGWGVFMLVAAAVVTLMDNVLRPLLIRVGADLPLVLIFAGVIGGLLAFGLIGIFAGPVVLAVAYMLFQDWIGVDEAVALPADEPPASS